MAVEGLLNAKPQETRVSFSQYIDADNELRRALVVSIAGAQSGGEGGGALTVASYQIIEKVTPVVDAAAYAVNEVLSDPFEIENFFPAIDVPMRIDKFLVLDKSNQTAFDMKLYVFDDEVSLGTRNGVVSITDDDAEHIVAKADIASGDGDSLVNSVLYKLREGPISVLPVAGTRTLRMQLRMGAFGTPTLVTGALEVTVGGYR